MKEAWVESGRIQGNQELAQKYGVSPMAMRLIRSRAGKGEKEIQEYLQGTIEGLADPFLMKGMQEAVQLILKKVKDGAAFRIIGDYDIDGVNATHILVTGLRRIGAQADTVIPERLKDGYGLNENLIRDAKAAGIDTIVTCDNGIAAAEEIAFARREGMTVIVTDHHDIPYREAEGGVRTSVLPPADVILNPKQEGCAYPFKKLCGAAVAWRLVDALYRTKGIPEEETLALAEFAAVATVGDIMDLQGENRILVKYGLKRLENTENPGYRALITVNGLAGKKLTAYHIGFVIGQGENRILVKYGLKRLENTENPGYRALITVNGLAGKKLTAYHIGFVIGPCINASGRLDTAKRALRLLEAGSQREAEELAGDLKALNDSRKELTVKGTEEAVKMIEETELKKDRVLIVYLPDCHESLAGIIAGRIRERYFKPCFVLTDAEEGVKGSGRSIPGYHMFEEMTKVGRLFTKFGGHPMAAGLSLPAENVEIFRREINENCRLTEEDLQPKVYYDAVLPVCYAGEQIIRELELLEPFGKGNEKPLFAAGGLTVKSARLIGKNQNVMKLALEDREGNRTEAIRFGEVKEELDYIETKEQVSILYYPEVNEYQGRRNIQLVLEGIR